LPVSWVSPVLQPPVTRAVETVEKVTFQKIILKSGTKTLKSTYFYVLNNILTIFETVVGDFYERFSN